MYVTSHKTQCYCDACGKLIYEKDENVPVSISTDFYEITFDHYDINLNMGRSRAPSGVHRRITCSEKCIYDVVLPVYFAKVSSKKNSLQNTEGVSIRHHGYV